VDETALLAKGQKVADLLHLHFPPHNHSRLAS
jgi:hypothetical protein